MKNKINLNLKENLKNLKLSFILDNYEEIIKQIINKKLSYLDFLNELIEGEVLEKKKNKIERKIKLAKFPYIKNFKEFDWNYPHSIDKEKILFLSHLNFIDKKENIIFLSSVGLGKTHLSIALGYKACLKNYSVLYTTINDILNELCNAKKINNYDYIKKKYLKPQLLIIDDFGHISTNKDGLNVLFDIISKRYETGSIILNSNREFKEWITLFNNDSYITSAIIDRLIHHSETIVIQGNSYRTKSLI